MTMFDPWRDEDYWPPGGLPHGEHPYDYGYEPEPPRCIYCRASNLIDSITMHRVGRLWWCRCGAWMRK